MENTLQEAIEEAYHICTDNMIKAALCDGLLISEYESELCGLNAEEIIQFFKNLD